MMSYLHFSSLEILEGRNADFSRGDNPTFLWFVMWRDELFDATSFLQTLSTELFDAYILLILYASYPLSHCERRIFTA
jgi:hypothetical protein